MKKEFLVNIVLLVAINILIKPFYLFGIETEVQNTVGLSEWGRYYELFTFCHLFGFIHDPGLLSYNKKTVAESPSLLKFMFSPIIGGKFLLGGAFLLISLIGFFFMGYDQSWIVLMILLCLCQFLGSFYLLLRSNVAGVGMYRLDSFFSAFDKLLMIIIVGGLIFLPHFKSQVSVEYFVWAQIIALLIANIVAYLVITQKIPERLPSFSLMYLKNLIKQTLPYGMIALLMIIYTRIDGLMLGRMLNDSTEVGIYGSCYRIIDSLSMVGNIFGTLLVSMFAALIGQKQKTSELLELALRTIITISISAFVVIGLSRGTLLNMLYDGYTSYFDQILLVLLGGFVFMTIAYIIGALLTAEGILKSMNKLFISGIFINIGLNILLIPTYKAYGAGIATMFTEAAIMLGLFIIVKKEVKIQYSSAFLRQVLIFIVASGLLYIGLDRLDLPYQLQLLYSSIGMILIAFLSGIFSIRYLRDILRSE